MKKLIRRVLATVFQPQGRHRATPPLTIPLARPAVAVDNPTMLIDGEAVALVRPYLIAHEHRIEQQRRRERRRALVLATMGFDYVGVAQ